MIRLVDSRRLTGPHLLGDRPGAALDVAGPESQLAADLWRYQARRLLDQIGWEGEEVAARIFEGGASLVITAPVDALYAATEVNEAAWDAAAAQLDGSPSPDLEETAGRLRAAIARERDPRLVELHHAARARGLTFLCDDDLVSAGPGTGALVWPRSELPRASEVAWGLAHDIPIVLVSGSNGKTTTARLVAAIAAASGLTPALTSTDGVSVGGVRIAEGDYSGPSGARLLLRCPDGEAAVLETARGGMLRRGLPLERADVAVVTNVADDHLGEFGIQDLAALAEVKLLVARSTPTTRCCGSALRGSARRSCGSRSIPSFRRPPSSWPRVTERPFTTTDAWCWWREASGQR